MSVPQALKAFPEAELRRPRFIQQTTKEPQAGQQRRGVCPAAVGAGSLKGEDDEVWRGGMDGILPFWQLCQVISSPLGS